MLHSIQYLLLELGFENLWSVSGEDSSIYSCEKGQNWMFTLGTQDTETRTQAWISPQWCTPRVCLDFFLYKWMGAIHLSGGRSHLKRRTIAHKAHAWQTEGPSFQHPASPIKGSQLEGDMKYYSLMILESTASLSWQYWPGWTNKLIQC